MTSWAAKKLSTGIFYSAFLLSYGMDKTRIGILTFIPYIACLFGLLTPYVLERFPKRKNILVGGKFAYYALNIIGITLLPRIVPDTQARIFWFVVLVFAANAVDMLFASGFTAWTANYLSDNIRNSFFAISMFLQNGFTYGITILLSFIGDRVSGTVYEQPFLIGVRYVAFGIALVDCVIWLYLKEYPYPKVKKVRLVNVFILPIRNKKYLGAVAIGALYNLAINVPLGVATTYVYEDVGISYSLFNIVSICYALFIALFSGVWKRFIARYYYFRSILYTLLMYVPVNLAYFFVTSERIWLYVVIRLMEHTLFVCFTMAVNSLPYVYLPDEDHTCYISFYTIVSNMAIFLATMAGTVFTKFMDGKMVESFGQMISGMRLIFPMASGMMLLCVAVMSVITKQLVLDNNATRKEKVNDEDDNYV